MSGQRLLLARGAHPRSITNARAPHIHRSISTTIGQGGTRSLEAPRNGDQRDATSADYGTDRAVGLGQKQPEAPSVTPIVPAGGHRDALAVHLSQVLAGWCGGATVIQTRRALLKALDLLEGVESQ